ncbi:hypothetical protein IMG5_095890 [Ichthyophthirius multifiliis]|uniref:Uncharacterized protein n=1 Tax=Ichthyophthirius multifiliis TaxID=5932 RepID=G0QRP0_ICHMU|nr:hypothetical protein IMG5_095890 [Ichthyophthirius multifiliis]EGR32115.1 hypothetical protein IMG5_095890 [Ichthyophthirius multifiliis]|eukprot:XP_004035601.1 hypothetical protein IMG5_095890 [Ichthyophthirius multifiliis]
MFLLPTIGYSINYKILDCFQRNSSFINFNSFIFHIYLYDLLFHFICKNFITINIVIRFICFIRCYPNKMFNQYNHNYNSDQTFNIIIINNIISNIITSSYYFNTNKGYLFFNSYSYQINLNQKENSSFI